MKKTGLKVSMVITVILGTAFSQTVERTANQQLQKVFDEGVTYFNTEKYWDALSNFQQVAAANKNENPLLSSAQLMVLKTTYRLGELDRSAQLARTFLQTFPDSRYVTEVREDLAEILLAQGKYREALNYYLDVLKSGDDAFLRSSSEEAIEKILGFYFTAEEIRALRDFTSDPFIRQFLTLKLAEKLHAEGDSRQAHKELRQVAPSATDKYLRNQVAQTENRLKSLAAPRVYVGVVLPLSGSNAALGQKILNGLKYALAQYRQAGHAEIAALVLDNRSEVAQSVRQVEFLAGNPRVCAIIGPLTSEETIAVAAIANNQQIPLLTPTASSSQISTLSPYIFQVNLDYENLGRFLGLYGVRVAGIKSAASLAPADEFGKEFTDAFCRALDEYGASIISQQWYSGEPADLKNQIANIHKAAVERVEKQVEFKINEARQNLKNLALNPPAPILKIVVDEPYCTIIRQDTTLSLTLRETLIYTGLMKISDFEIPRRDTLTFPSGLVDGFLIPARASDANLIVPQINYFDIRAQFLGSGNWNDPELLKRNKDLLKGLYFISDFYIDPDNRTFKTMATGFAKVFGNEPGRFELYGYDTMKALLSVMEAQEISRSAIRRGLLEMPVYRGLGRIISFKGNRPRVNSCGFILRYDNNRVRPAALIENGQLIIGQKVIR